MNENNHTLRGILCTTVGGIFWGFSGTCGEYLFTRYGVSPVWLTCIRLLTSGAILTAMAIPHHRADMAAIFRHPRDLAHLACYGVFGLMLCQYAYMVAISYSNAGTTTVLQNLSLILIMLVACVQNRQRPNKVQTVSLLLALTGTYILATGGDPRQMVLSPKGLLWGLATAVAVTVYTLLPRRLLPRWGREIVTGYGMLIGAFFLNVAARSWQFEVRLPVQGWLAILAIVILGSVVAFTLFMQGVTDIGPVKSSMLAATEPVAATLFSALWLHTAFSLTDLVGFVFILATIFLLAKEES